MLTAKTLISKDCPIANLIGFHFVLDNHEMLVTAAPNEENRSTMPILQIRAF